MNLNDFCSNLKNKLKKLLLRLTASRRTPVPTGLTQYENLINNLIDLYNPPMSRNDIRFVIAAMLQRLEPKERARKSLQSFNEELCRAAATQVGGHMIFVLKQEQAVQQAAEAAQLAAAKSNEVIAYQDITSHDHFNKE